MSIIKICVADDSHVMPRIIFIIMLSAAYVTDTLMHIYQQTTF